MMTAKHKTSENSNDHLEQYDEEDFKFKVERFTNLIEDITMMDLELTTDDRRQIISENVNFPDFAEQIMNIFGREILPTNIKSVYKKLTSNPEKMVDWTELFGYEQSGFDGGDQEKELETIKKADDISIIAVNKRTIFGDASGGYKNRDVIQNIQYVPSIDAFLTISKKGVVLLWNEQLKVQMYADLKESSWGTAIEFLPKIKKIAASTERSISFVDYRSKGQAMIFTVKPLFQSPLCLCWMPLSSVASDETVIFGDNQGYLNVLTISSMELFPSQESASFTSSKSKQRQFSDTYRINPNSLRNPIIRRQFHNDWVIKIKYFPSLKCFGSCSADETASFYLEPIDKLLDKNSSIQSISIPKGVNAFDYCKSANIIATGGVDKIIRIWHPHIWAQPTGKLTGHIFSVCELVCIDKHQHIISMSTAQIFRVWDIQSLSCLQTFNDGGENFMGEKRIYSVSYEWKNERLITGSSLLTAWPLTRSIIDSMNVPQTHFRPVMAIDNCPSKQICVSVCTEPVIKIWQTETGQLINQWSKPHDDNEIVSVDVDESGFHLVTASFNGCIKIWDIGSGQELKNFWEFFQTSQESESVIGFVRFLMREERQLIMAIGWNHRIKLFQQIHELRTLKLIEEHELNLTKRVFKLPEASIHSANSVFNSYEVLPEIAKSMSSASFSLYSRENTMDVELQEEHPADTSQTMNQEPPSELVDLHPINCLKVLENKLLIFGHQNGEISIYSFINFEQLTVFESESPSEQNCVNCVDTLTLSININNASKYPVEVFWSKESGKVFSEKGIDKSDEVNKYLSRHVTTANEKLEKTLSKLSLTSSYYTKPKRVETESNASSNNLSNRLIRFLDNNHIFIIGGFQNGYINFWSLIRSNLRPTTRSIPSPCYLMHLNKFQPKTRLPPAAVTTISILNNVYTKHVDCVCGDSRGYLTTFNLNDTITSFLDGKSSQKNVKTQLDQINSDENDHQDVFLPTTASSQRLQSQQHNHRLSTQCPVEPIHISVPINQLVYWKAHTSTVTAVRPLNEKLGAWMSSSEDGSIRVFRVEDGLFIGYFNQENNFDWDKLSKFKVNQSSKEIKLPYDIAEKPVLTKQRSDSAKQRARNLRNVDYPLTFSEQKWDPFNRNHFIDSGGINRHISNLMEKPLAKKFFKAVIKYKPTNKEIGAYMLKNANVGQHSSAFGTLPVYQVNTPDDLQLTSMSSRLAASCLKQRDQKKNKKSTIRKREEFELKLPTSQAQPTVIETEAE